VPRIGGALSIRPADPAITKAIVEASNTRVKRLSTDRPEPPPRIANFRLSIAFRTMVDKPLAAPSGCSGRPILMKREYRRRRFSRPPTLVTHHLALDTVRKKSGFARNPGSQEIWCDSVGITLAFWLWLVRLRIGGAIAGGGRSF
jgi:hypothetical protein